MIKLRRLEEVERQVEEINSLIDWWGENPKDGVSYNEINRLAMQRKRIIDEAGFTDTYPQPKIFRE